MKNPLGNILFFIIFSPAVFASRQIYVPTVEVLFQVVADTSITGSVLTSNNCIVRNLITFQNISNLEQTVSVELNDNAQFNCQGLEAGTGIQFSYLPGSKRNVGTITLPPKVDGYIELDMLCNRDGITVLSYQQGGSTSKPGGFVTPLSPSSGKPEFYYLNLVARYIVTVTPDRGAVMGNVRSFVECPITRIIKTTDFGLSNNIAINGGRPF